jgi:hypothetical protein
LRVKVTWTLVDLATRPGSDAPSGGVHMALSSPSGPSIAMRIDPAIRSFLSGTELSSGLLVRIASKTESFEDRLSLLEARARGRAVVHLGCADHPALIESKRKSGLWLHDRLSRSAARCLGIDTSREGIELLSKLGVSDVICADILHDPLPQLDAIRWDYLVAGEVLEHVDDPVSFLRGIAGRCAGRVDKIILTVPNALSLRNALGALRGTELVNSDHRYWFTPYTLAKVATRAGLDPEQFFFCDAKPREHRPSLRIWNGDLVSRWLLRRSPALRATLVMEARMP